MLRTVRDCCVPHDHVLRPDGRADIEDIALAVHAAERDTEAFFARNHVTAGMRQLFETGFTHGKDSCWIVTLRPGQFEWAFHCVGAF
jgi:hypothetical protein